MPTPIKAVLSVVKLLVAAAGFWFQQSLGQDTAKWVVAFLGVFMVVSMWVFPEVARTKGAPAGKR